MVELQGQIAKFKELETPLVAISVDPVETSTKLASDLSITFPIVADTERKLTKAVGLFDSANDIAWPAVIVVDAHGKVAWVHTPPSYVKEERPSVEEILGQVRNASLR